MGYPSHMGVFSARTSGPMLTKLILNIPEILYVPVYNNDNTQQVPPYVSSVYYCETAAHVYTCCENWFYLNPNDTLWDGQQCVAQESPCCTHPNNMPWFLKTLNEAMP